jgi:hypothetical protein
MPFNDPWDVTKPADNDPVSQGDDEIRRVKRALNERLTQVIEGWPDTDPLKLRRDALNDQIEITYGEFSLRPAAVEDGQFFYATDRRLLYFSHEDPNVGGQFVWAVSTAVVNLVNDLPDATEVEPGQLYFSYTNQNLYTSHSGAWHSVSAPAVATTRAARYDVTQAVGARLIERGPCRTMDIRAVNVTTDATGQILIPYTEFSGEGISLSSIRSLIVSGEATASGSPVLAYATAGLSSIGLEFFSSFGTSYNNLAVNFNLHIAYT